MLKKQQELDEEGTEFFPAKPVTSPFYVQNLKDRDKKKIEYYIQEDEERRRFWRDEIRRVRLQKVYIFLLHSYHFHPHAELNINVIGF
jgi:hypothetical protein